MIPNFYNRATPIALSLLLLAASCASPPPKEEIILQQRSILVLPIINETTSAEAPDAVMCTLGNPLIQRGYYVFPVIPTNELLRSEGLFEGGQLYEIPAESFRETLGADAVLYVTLHSWDTDYAVITSSVSVSMTYRLVDTATGALLWENSATRVVTSDTNSNSSGNLLADLIAMAVSAAVNAATQEYVPLARQANVMALKSLPIGPVGRELRMQAELASAKVEESDLE
jgi:hypothetical protein